MSDKERLEYEIKNQVNIEEVLKRINEYSLDSTGSWKKQYSERQFTSKLYNDCTFDEKEEFLQRLVEVPITIANKISDKVGRSTNLMEVIGSALNKKFEKISKNNRRVIFSTSDGTRPIGDAAYSLWNGFQVIDLDIKNHETAVKLKPLIFWQLCKFNWFLGVTLSASGNGIHIWTKIQLSESDKESLFKEKIMYFANFRHKFSFVFIALVNAIKDESLLDMLYTEDTIIQWMDLAMFKPQQGAFIGYDRDVMINTGFWDDFIYINFSNVEDMGHPDVDWVTHPRLKELLKRYQWFENKSEEDLNNPKNNFELTSAPIPDSVTNKVHYKHTERWQLANTLVKIYGFDAGYKYLRSIVSNKVKDKELHLDCVTAERHAKELSFWAVAQLNKYHGFNIEVKREGIETKPTDIDFAISQVTPVSTFLNSDNKVKIHLKENEYLSDKSDEILSNLGHITLIEAGAGYGKTEMIKSMIDKGLKILLVMPFTSTLMAKTENAINWETIYGNRRQKFEKMGTACTIDKFSKMTPQELELQGIDLIVIDESHLLFQSDYRPVMPKAIDLIKILETKTILMTGTVMGEPVFFKNDLKYIHVTKDDRRIKEFNVNLIDDEKEKLFVMCRDMAYDIIDGKRIIFPTNRGSVFEEHVRRLVNRFLEENEYFETLELNYYKKSNFGDKFMDDINNNKTIGDTKLLMCTNYLSVGIDIVDRERFAVYFDTVWMPQEIEQFANRVRNNDLYLKLYIAKKDKDGNNLNLHLFKELNMNIDKDDLRNAHAAIQICNEKLERNPQVYKYDPIVSSLLSGVNYIAFNENENKYYLHETAYKIMTFEDRYRTYICQLPVLINYMQKYGYMYKINDNVVLGVPENLLNALLDEATLSKKYVHGIQSEDIRSLLDHIKADTFDIYKDVLKGTYEIKKGRSWKEDVVNKKITCKNIEVFEKTIPIVISMSKMYDIDSIKEIFLFAYDVKQEKYNFSLLRRIKTLINIVYNNKLERLDIPILEYMQSVYSFVDHFSPCNKGTIQSFIMENAKLYAERKSNKQIIISKSLKAIDVLYSKMEDLFNALVEKSRPKGPEKLISLKKFDLLWKEKEVRNEKKTIEFDDINRIFFIGNILDNNTQLEKNFEEPVFIYDVEQGKLKEKNGEVSKDININEFNIESNEFITEISTKKECLNSLKDDDPPDK